MSFLNHNRRKRRSIGLLSKNAGGGKRQAHKYPEKGACHERHASEKINRIPRERAQDLCVGNDNTFLVDAHPSDTYGRE
jgi:hypothetical protein